MCKLLLDNRAYIDDKIKLGHTALLLAAQDGHMETYKLPLDKGAGAYSKTNDGATIHLAAETVNVEICELLLDSKNISNKKNNGFTAPHSATMKWHGEV